MIYFSPSAAGFFRSDVHGDRMPADVVPVTKEDYNALLAGQSSGKIIKPDTNGHPVLVDLPAPILTSESLCRDIDQAADSARAMVAGDPLRAVEYEKAAVEAQVFKDSGYPAGVVPRTVAAWAINGRTARQAADNILAEAAAYNEALYQIREARLSAKEQVRQAMAANQVEQARLIAAATIDSIRAAITSIGNAGA